MIEQSDASWCAEFSTEELAAVRFAIPQAIQDSQERSARAHAAWADPDGDQDVYGVGMSRGAQKELQSQLQSLASYREVRVAGTRRTLTYVGNALLFIHRVGKRMPRNHRRIRLSYLPDSRRDLLQSTSTSKYSEPGLFDLPTEEDTEAPRLSDAIHVLNSATQPEMLFVPYFSSTPFGIGSMFWGPARLSGSYLELTEPERLTFVRTPAAMPGRLSSRLIGGFAQGERPRTPTRLRNRPIDPSQPASS